MLAVAGKEIKLWVSAGAFPVTTPRRSCRISQAILEELADLMTKQGADIKNVEVQGHTDDTGAAAYNLRLSQSRAQAVVDAIAALGVDSSRMHSQGLRPEKPLLCPTALEANRAKNRRVSGDDHRQIVRGLPLRPPVNVLVPERGNGYRADSSDSSENEPGSRRSQICCSRLSFPHTIDYSSSAHAIRWRLFYPTGTSAERVAYSPFGPRLISSSNSSTRREASWPVS